MEMRSHKGKTPLPAQIRNVIYAKNFRFHFCQLTCYVGLFKEYPNISPKSETFHYYDKSFRKATESRSSKICLQADQGHLEVQSTCCSSCSMQLFVKHQISSGCDCVVTHNIFTFVFYVVTAYDAV